ncbi:hypothetical protein A3F08_00425 [Candidatus Berkelbacteria bacterium RIFCSPHIGHO2_12_FULL_36_9]|uniref:Uncharacterized protein n=1 Tax=Candidatus Berkelbacteria bacterium RIFCSPHIGHO2_12_FULL_36_9 TaxID=1797469 RepID=A0A1F5EKD5_9BACT|nr:MAG: hypothetical protein A3F08_00425 [Candidatus Berkelbacteria bacterium RIFCSPHIGHO2_12_FULL_36_9]
MSKWRHGTQYRGLIPEKKTPNGKGNCHQSQNSCTGNVPVDSQTTDNPVKSCFVSLKTRSSFGLDLSSVLREIENRLRRWLQNSSLKDEIKMTVKKEIIVFINELLQKKPSGANKIKLEAFLRTLENIFPQKQNNSLG